MVTYVLTIISTERRPHPCTPARPASLPRSAYSFQVILVRGLDWLLLLDGDSRARILRVRCAVRQPPAPLAVSWTALQATSVNMVVDCGRQLFNRPVARSSERLARKNHPGSREVPVRPAFATRARETSFRGLYAVNAVPDAGALQLVFLDPYAAKPNINTMGCTTCLGSRPHPHGLDLQNTAWWRPEYCERHSSGSHSNEACIIPRFVTRCSPEGIQCSRSRAGCISPSGPARIAEWSRAKSTF